VRSLLFSKIWHCVCGRSGGAPRPRTLWRRCRFGGGALTRPEASCLARRGERRGLPWPTTRPRPAAPPLGGLRELDFGRDVADSSATAAAEDATLAQAAAGVALAGAEEQSRTTNAGSIAGARRPLLDRRALYRSAEAPCDRTTFLARNPNGEDGDDAHSASEVGPKDNPDVGSTGRRPRPGRQAGRCQQQPCGRRRRPTREKPRPPASSNRAGPLRTPRCRPRWSDKSKEEQVLRCANRLKPHLTAVDSLLAVLVGDLR